MAKLFINSAARQRWLGLGLLALSALLARDTYGQYDPDWARNFRVGILAGFNIKADFRMSGTFDISGSNPGPIDQRGAEHIFDDGYVRVDDFDNAQGYTTYWGYQNASQYDAANNRLLFHSSSEFSTSSSPVEKGDAPFVGFDMAYGGNLWYWKRMRIGWEFGFGLLPISISDSRQLSANVLQSTYAFDLNGVIPPTAPYNGGSSGFGQPSIDDIARLLSSTNLSGVPLNGSRTLDVTLYTLRLGPSIFLDLNRYIGIAASAGPAVGFISGQYRFNETIDAGNGLVRNKGHFGASDIVIGGYVSGTITYHTVKNGDLYLSAQYMPLGKSTFRGADRQASLNLQGAVFVSAGINWPF